MYCCVCSRTSTVLSAAHLQVVRPTDNQPGIAARPAAAAPSQPFRTTSAPAVPATLNVTLRREAVALASVGSARISLQGVPVGYIRLDTFASTSAAEVRAAVRRLTQEGAQGVHSRPARQPWGPR